MARDEEGGMGDAGAVARADLANEAYVENLEHEIAELRSSLARIEKTARAMGANYQSIKIGEIAHAAIARAPLSRASVASPTSAIQPRALPQDPRHRPLTLPADRSKLIERAIREDHGEDFTVLPQDRDAALIDECLTYYLARTPDHPPRIHDALAALKRMEASPQDRDAAVAFVTRLLAEFEEMESVHRGAYHGTVLTIGRLKITRGDMLALRAALAPPPLARLAPPQRAPAEPGEREATERP